MARGPHSTRGFSLMELMVVLAIFGTLLGFGVPSYQRYSQTPSLRGTAQNLVNTIQLQRSRAMANGQNVRIDFDTALSMVLNMNRVSRPQAFEMINHLLKPLDHSKPAIK